MSTPLTDDKQMVVNVFSKNRPKIRAALPAGLLACLMLSGCGDSNEFNPAGVLQSRPVRLDGEQVILGQEHLECGAHEDLWIIAPMGEGRAVARLAKKARDLQFSDDVQIGDPVIGAPYAQLRGSFPVNVIRIGSVRDEDAYTKLADVKVSVKIGHSCFQNNPPLLMGIRHGRFDQSRNPVFRFRLDGGWQADQVIH